MTVVVGVVVGALFVVGLAGAALPVLPGTPLILAGAVLYAIATGFVPVGLGRLAVLGALTALALALHYAGGALGARRYGGSAWGVAGALLGAVAGLSFGPLGLVLGPIVGAALGELLRGAPPARSVRSGMGALVGMVAGVVANVSVGLVMIALFLWWAWRG